jgi:rhamnulokinase
MLGLDGEWDTVLMNAIGLKKAITRMPVPAGTVLGDGTGIASGMKIIAPATHDTASAVAGTPLENQNEAYICSGTWSLMGIESLAPIATAAALVMNFTNEGGFEKRFRVLKNIAGMWPIQRICEEHAGADVEALVRQAELAQPWRSVVDLGDPAFLNPASMSDSIRGYCRDTSQPVPETVAQMARCVFDSLALSYRKCKEQLEQFLGRKISTIRIVGGGCQNRLLNQLCADACECPVIAGPVEASVLGNLSAQMIALGILEDLDAARSVTRHSFVSEAYRPKASVPHAAMSRFEELLSMHEPRERQTHD